MKIISRKLRNAEVRQANASRLRQSWQTENVLVDTTIACFDPPPEMFSHTLNVLGHSPRWKVKHYKHLTL